LQGYVRTGAVCARRRSHSAVHWSLMSANCTACCRHMASSSAEASSTSARSVASPVTDRPITTRTSQTSIRTVLPSYYAVVDNEPPPRRLADSTPTHAADKCFCGSTQAQGQEGAPRRLNGPPSLRNISNICLTAELIIWIKLSSGVSYLWQFFYKLKEWESKCIYSRPILSRSLDVTRTTRHNAAPKKGHKMSPCCSVLWAPLQPNMLHHV